MVQRVGCTQHLMLRLHRSGNISIDLGVLLREQARECENRRELEKIYSKILPRCACRSHTARRLIILIDGNDLKILHYYHYIRHIESEKMIELSSNSIVPVSSTLSLSLHISKVRCLGNHSSSRATLSQREKRILFCCLYHKHEGFVFLFYI